MMVSFFESAKSTTPAKSITIDQFLDDIKAGKWMEFVGKLRNEPNPEKRKALKLSAPAITPSGLFRSRKAAELITHSGFVCIDIDTECDRSQLEKDPYTYALFDSISKRGIAIIVKVDPLKHKDCFAWLQNYYFDSYGIAIDPAPSSVVSLRTISFDANLYSNPKSLKAKSKRPAPPKPKSLPLILSDEQFNTCVDMVVERGIDLAPTYELYRQLGFAICDHLGEAGRAAFHKICSISEKYSEAQADSFYTNTIRRQPDSKVTIGTFYFMLKEAGIPIPNNSSQYVSIAAIAKKSGRKQQDVENQLIETNNLSPKDAKIISTEAFNRSDITVSTVAADPEHLIEGLLLFMKQNYPLKRNGITHKIELKGEPITDEDINDIYLDARSLFNSPMVTKDIVQSIIFSNRTPTYNPFEVFIAKHAHIRTEGHIDAIIDCIRTTTPMYRQFIRKWLIAIHAAIDGKAVRLMLVFVGPQYNGKTEFFRRLLPAQLKSYYAESKLDRGKDDEILMCQKLIIMDDEMGGKSKQDEKRLKELTSRDFFSLRAPYRRDNMDYKRLAVLGGTSNPTEIINDPTGNTRILPVKVDSIDYEALNKVDRVALFMECHRAYEAGESWELTKDEIEPLNALSDDFSSISYERELIEQYFQPSELYSWLTAVEIKNHIETNSRQQIRNMTKFGIELKKYLGEPKPKRRSVDPYSKVSSPRKCYGVRIIDSNDNNVVDPHRNVVDPPTTFNYSDNQAPPF